MNTYQTAHQVTVTGAIKSAMGDRRLAYINEKHQDSGCAEIAQEMKSDIAAYGTFGATDADEFVEAWAAAYDLDIDELRDGMTECLLSITDAFNPFYHTDPLDPTAKRKMINDVPSRDLAEVLKEAETIVEADDPSDLCPIDTMDAEDFGFEDANQQTLNDYLIAEEVLAMNTKSNKTTKLSLTKYRVVRCDGTNADFTVPSIFAGKLPTMEVAKSFPCSPVFIRIPAKHYLYTDSGRQIVGPAWAYCPKSPMMNRLSHGTEAEPIEVLQDPSDDTISRIVDDLIGLGFSREDIR